MPFSAYGTTLAYRPKQPAVALKRRKKPKENIYGITRPNIRKLARRGGICRFKVEIYDSVRETIKRRVEDVLAPIALRLKYKKQKTVTAQDVIWSLKRLGTTIYGFD